jgi:hypothetical protein
MNRAGGSGCPGTFQLQCGGPAAEGFGYRLGLYVCHPGHSAAQRCFRRDVPVCRASLQAQSLVSALPLKLPYDIGPVGMAWLHRDPGPAVVRVIEALRKEGCLIASNLRSR